MGQLDSLILMIFMLELDSSFALYRS